MLMKKLRLKFVGKKFFCPNEASQVKTFEIWPGYATAFSVFNGLSRPLAVLNVDIMHKVITNQNVLTKIIELRDRHQRDYEQVINQEFIGSSVMTSYNRKIYRIDRIDYSKSPLDTFTNHEGQQIKFIDYYQNTYK